MTVAGQVATVNDTTTGTMIPVELSPAPTIQPTATVVAEVFVPDGRTAGNQFFIGSNDAAETGPSYLKAADCGASEPITFDAAAASLPAPRPVVRILLSVTGVY